MDKTKINVDLEVEIEKLGLELINFKRSKEKVIKTCEQMIEYYKRLINGHNEEIALKEKDINLKVINLSQDLEFHETKTLKTLELPSFTLRLVKQSRDMRLKDEYNEDEIPDSFINVKKYVRWQQFKTQLSIVGDNVVLNETGEVLSSIEIVNKPEKFEIKSKW